MSPMVEQQPLPGHGACALSQCSLCFVLPGWRLEGWRWERNYFPGASGGEEGEMDSCGDEASGWDRKGGSRQRCGLDTLSTVSERCHWKSPHHVFSLETVLGFGHLVMTPAGHTQQHGTLVGQVIVGHLGSPGSPGPGRMRTAMTRQ